MYGSHFLCYAHKGETYQKEGRMKQLVECLGIKPGITTFIGAGGKTSAIFQVARELKARNKRVVVSTTTKMYYPNKEQSQVVLIAPSEEEIARNIEEVGAVVIAGGHEAGKITGISEELLQVVVQYADYILIEGDGSKRLPLKVPAVHEPVIPATSKKVVIVVGLASFNQPLEAVCFRVEKAMALLGIASHERVNEETLRHLITSPKALQQGIDDKEQVLLLNQVDKIKNEETLDHIIKVIKKAYTYPIISSALALGIWEEV